MVYKQHSTSKAHVCMQATITVLRHCWFVLKQWLLVQNKHRGFFSALILLPNTENTIYC